MAGDKKTGYEFWTDTLKSPRHVAAPMVDMSELAFRLLCRRHGAQLCYSPMLHSQQFIQDPLYRVDSFSTSSEDGPLIVQFCANDPDVFTKAAAIVSTECDAVDLNLGCPQAIAKKGHYGAFLQDEWGLIHSIVRKASVDLPVPVTCKMRILPKPIMRSVEYAKMLESAGCSVLTVHGRTRFQKGHDTGLAMWDVIKEIKQNVKIPVISNGNILNYGDVEACLNYTGADAVMSAEALLHNPALFSGRNPPVWEMAEEYLTLAEKHNTPLRIVRNHVYRILYLCLHQDSKLKTLLENSSEYDDFRRICDNLKELPSKCVHSHLQDEDRELCDIISHLNVREKPLDEIDLADLFASCAYENNGVVSDHANDFLVPISDSDTSVIVEKFQSICKTLDTDIIRDSSIEKFSVADTEQESSVRYLPFWKCHSRPRITLSSGNRGCYSKYFTNAEDGSIEPSSYLSKRQQRKARHYARVLAAMKENRKTKKLRRKQKLLEQRENSGQKEDKSRSIAGITRKQMKQEIRQRMESAKGVAPKICIDLRFTSEMSEKDLQRLSCQLRRLYGSNRHSETPLHLHFCNFSETNPLYKICVAKNEGFQSYVVDMVEESPEDLFPSTELLYLSPDSKNVLETFDSNRVYVIGGIVDNSVKKGLTLTHAADLNIQTVRLPILENLKRNGSKSGTTVLTVNQVFDILLKFYETGDWIEALQAGVPQRKGFRASQSESSDAPQLEVEPETTCDSAPPDIVF